MGPMVLWLGNEEIKQIFNVSFWEWEKIPRL